MGTPKQFNNIIQKELNVFAAWVPIVNQYKIGDYGIFADGVFARLGNITDDFKVQFTPGEGEVASIDFTSEGARVIRIAGKAEVDVIPPAATDASVVIEFTKEKSFLVKSPTINVTTIDNINETAKKLKALDNWDGKWKVVHQIYNAKDAVVISSIQAGTKLNFTGNASSLGQMKLGSSDLNIDTNKTLGLKINGKSGIIGLGLFRVKSKLLGGWKVDILKESTEVDPLVILKPDSYEDDV